MAHFTRRSGLRCPLRYMPLIRSKAGVHFPKPFPVMAITIINTLNHNHPPIVNSPTASRFRVWGKLSPPGEKPNTAIKGIISSSWRLFRLSFPPPSWWVVWALPIILSLFGGAVYRAATVIIIMQTMLFRWMVARIMDDRLVLCLCEIVSWGTCFKFEIILLKKHFFFVSSISKYLRKSTHFRCVIPSLCWHIPGPFKGAIVHRGKSNTIAAAAAPFQVQVANYTAGCVQKCQRNSSDRLPSVGKQHTHSTRACSGCSCFILVFIKRGILRTFRLSRRLVLGENPAAVSMQKKIAKLQ